MASIFLRVPIGRTNGHTNRHHTQSQNRLALCDFDMHFTYVYAQWKGSAYNARVLEDALSQPTKFLMPSQSDMLALARCYV